MGEKTQMTAEITNYFQSSLGRISPLRSLNSPALVSAVDACRRHTFKNGASLAVL